VLPVIEFEDFKTFRSLCALVLQAPLIPELVFTTPIRRKVLEFCCTMLEGMPSRLNKAALKEHLYRFQEPADLRP
jgi:hypothetical protein